MGGINARQAELRRSPLIVFGNQLVVGDARIPKEQVLALLASSHTVKGICRRVPGLRPDEVMACVADDQAMAYRPRRTAEAVAARAVAAG